MKNVCEEDEESEELSQAIQGYCHFNEDGSNIKFSIDVFGMPDSNNLLVLNCNYTF